MEWLNENTFDAVVYGVLGILALWTMIKYKVPILCPACESGGTKLGMFKCYPPTGPGSRYCKTAQIMESMQDGKLYIMIGDKIEEQFNKIASELPKIMQDITTKLYTSVLKLVDRVSTEFAKLQKQIFEQVSSIIAEAIQLGQNLMSKLYTRIVQPMVDFILANIVRPIQQLLVEINTLRVEVVKVVTDALIKAQKYTVGQIDSALRTIDQGLLAIPEGLAQVIDQLTSHVNEISKTLTGEFSKTINEANRATAMIVTNGLREGENAINQSLAGAEAAINSVIKDGIETPINSIVDQFDEIVTTVSSLTGRFDAIASSVATLTGRVDQVTGQVTSLVGQVGDVVGNVTNLTGQIGDVTGKVTNLTAQFDNVTGELTSLTGRIGNVTGEVSNLVGKVNDVTGQITSLSQSFDGITGTMTGLSDQFKGLSGNMASLTGRFDGLVGDMSGLSGRFDSLTNTVSNITASLDETTGKITSLTGQVGDVVGNVTNLTGQIGNVTGKVTDLTALFDKTTGDVTALTGRIGSVTGEVTNLTGKVNDVTGKITSLTNNVNNIVARVDDATGKITALTGQIGGVTSDITNLSGRIGDVVGKVTNLTAQFDSVTGEITSLTGRIGNVTGEVSSLTGKIGDVTGKITSLTSQVEGVTAGFNNVYKNIDKVVGFTDNIVDGWNKIRDVKLSQKIKVNMPKGIPDISETINFGSPFSFLPKFSSLRTGDSSGVVIPGSVRIVGNDKVCKIGLDGKEYCMDVKSFPDNSNKTQVCSDQNSSVCITHEEYADALRQVDDKTYKNIVTSYSQGSNVCYDHPSGVTVCVNKSFFEDPNNSKYCDPRFMGLLCMYRSRYNDALYYDKVRKHPLGAQRPSPQGAGISVPDVQIPRVAFPDLSDGVIPDVNISAPELPKVDLGPVKNLGGFSLRNTVYKAGDDVWNEMMKYYEEAMRPIIQSIQTIMNMVLSIYESVKLFAAQYVNIDNLVSALSATGPQFRHVKRKDLQDAVYYVMASGPLGVSPPGRLMKVINDLVSSTFLPIINMIYEQIVVPIYNFTADVWDMTVASFDADLKPILIAGLYQVSIVVLEGLKFAGEVILEVAQEAAQSAVHVALYWFQRAADWFLFFIPSGTLRVNILALFALAILVFIVFGPHTNLFLTYYFKIPQEVRNVLWLVFAVYWLYLLAAY